MDRPTPFGGAASVPKTVCSERPVRPSQFNTRCGHGDPRTTDLAGTAFTSQKEMGLGIDAAKRRATLGRWDALIDVKDLPAANSVYVDVPAMVRRHVPGDVSDTPATTAATSISGPNPARPTTSFENDFSWVSPSYHT